MPLNHLFDVLAEIHTLSVPFKRALERACVLQAFPKDHFLLETPHVADQAFFLHSGFAMSYSFFKRRKQIEHFWREGDFIISMKSFFEQVPSAEFIQLMMPSDVLCISYNSLIDFLEKFPEANYIYRVIMSRHFECGRLRVRDLQHTNSLKRLQKLVKKLPEIEQVVPQADIASYLGIAPQSLSRVKKRHQDDT